MSGFFIPSGLKRKVVVIDTRECPCGGFFVTFSDMELTIAQGGKKCHCVKCGATRIFNSREYPVIKEVDDEVVMDFLSGGILKD